MLLPFPPPQEKNHEGVWIFACLPCIFSLEADEVSDFFYFAEWVIISEI